MSTSPNQNETSLSTTCKRVRSVLSPYLDGRARHGQAIRAHLAACPGCRRELRILEELSRLTGEMPLLETRPHLADRVRAQAVLSPKSAAPRVFQSAAVIAFFALSLWGAFEWGHMRGQGTAGPEAIGETAGAPEKNDGQGAVEPRKNNSLAQNNDAVLQPVYLTPQDETAVRAARSTFADLELIENIPVELQSPLLASQVRYFGLDQWADSIDQLAPAHPASDIAALVHQLEDALADGLTRDSLLALKESAESPVIWTIDQGDLAVQNVIVHRPSPAIVVNELVELAAPDTKDSILEWIAFKEAWVESDDELDGLLELLDALSTPGLLSSQGTRSTGTFILPDLKVLVQDIDWHVGADGTRSGFLEMNSSNGNGHSSFKIEIHSDDLGIDFLPGLFDE